MRVAIISFGSQGDARPLIALGQSLARAGHQAVLLADAEFAALATEVGMEFLPLAGGSVRELSTHPEFAKLFQCGLNVRVVMQVLLNYVSRYTEAWGRQFREVASDADLVVAAGLTF